MILTKDAKLKNFESWNLNKQLIDFNFTRDFFEPMSAQIFRVFQETNIKDVKVVILGMDPYPNSLAIGRAFAVPQDANVPLSLREFIKEIRRVEKPSGLPFDLTLQHWVDQGVFLLNTALSVRSGDPGSHLNYWTKFTIDVIKKLNNNSEIVWGLLGANAKKFSQLINNKDNIVSWTHPAASRFGKPFYNSNFFVNINNKLKDKIIWQNM